MATLAARKCRCAVETGDSSLAIALGFGLLGLSQVPANARLGLLVAFALTASCVLTLGGLAALLGETARRSGRRLTSQTSPSRLPRNPAAHSCSREGENLDS